MEIQRSMMKKSKKGEMLEDFKKQIFKSEQRKIANEKWTTTSRLYFGFFYSHPSTHLEYGNSK